MTLLVLITSQRLHLQNHHDRGFRASTFEWIVCCFCLVTKSCPTLCNPMDCSLPGSAVHVISHARILEQVAISFSRGCAWPRDGTRISCIDKWVLHRWASVSQSMTTNSGSLQVWPPSRNLPCLLILIWESTWISPQSDFWVTVKTLITTE